MSSATSEEALVHTGCCHCGAIQFEVRAPSDLIVWKCNCSICQMRKNDHFVVPASCLTILKGNDDLTVYQFGTKTAKHMFCKICGITPFYVPRSNPDGYAVTYACVDKKTIRFVEHKDFDGENWESHFEKSGIKQLSKTSQ